MLRVVAVFAERDAPKERAVAAEIREELNGLATFLGADSVGFTSKVPPAWKSALH